KKIRGLHAMFSPRGWFSRARNARNHSRPSIRQGRAGEGYDSGKIVRGAGNVVGGRGKSFTGARIALSRDRALHRRSRLRFGQDLRPRSLVAGIPRRRDISGSFELLELRRFPGAPDESSLQRRGRKKQILSYAQRVGLGLAEVVRGADREFSAAGRFGADSGKAAGLLRRGRNSLGRLLSVFFGKEIQLRPLLL